MIAKLKDELEVEDALPCCPAFSPQMVGIAWPVFVCKCKQINGSADRCQAMVFVGRLWHLDSEGVLTGSTVRLQRVASAAFLV